MPIGGLKGFRHYVHLARTERKLRYLLERHRFGTLAAVQEAYEG
jgi:hypothetical protein